MLSNCDLVSNVSPLLIFCRYQMKCKSVSNVSPRYTRLQYGCTWINTHFMLVSEMPHGGQKQSGYGKDMSLYGLEDYTLVRHIMVKH